MRLGSVIYIIPFIFVLDVAFILQGSWYASAHVFAEAIFGGVWLMCARFAGLPRRAGQAGFCAGTRAHRSWRADYRLPQLNWVLAQPPSNTTG